MRHTISVLVENEFGVLARVAGLFSGRGFNIESLTVAETLDPSVSRLTLVTRGDDQVLDQVNQQLNKLINVIKVIDFTNTSHVERELALIKVNGSTREPRRSYAASSTSFEAASSTSAPSPILLEVTGAEDKIAALLELLMPLGIQEIARTGTVAMHRGMQLLQNRTRRQGEGCMKIYYDKDADHGSAEG